MAFEIPGPAKSIRVFDELGDLLGVEVDPEENYFNLTYKDLEIDLSSLKLIQKQHLLTVPFENLDIHIHKEIKVDIRYLYKKIIVKKRGGICYELNLLLSFLLKGIGFNTKILGGKVLNENGSYFDHMLLLVYLNNKKYIVDVGYGDNFLEPLELKKQSSKG